jgi:hypothetical protein
LPDYNERQRSVIVISARRRRGDRDLKFGAIPKARQSVRRSASKLATSSITFAQHSHATNDARLGGVDASGKLVERGVPKGIVSNKDSARPQMRECLLELKHHVIVGVQTIVNKNVERSEFSSERCKQSA